MCRQQHVSHVKETREPDELVESALPFLTSLPRPGTQTPKCRIFQDFWLSPLATCVSNIPSWPPHVQALASCSLLSSALLLRGHGGATQLPFQLHLRFIIHLRKSQIKKKISSKKSSYLKYQFPLRLFFNSS